MSKGKKGNAISNFSNWVSKATTGKTADEHMKGNTDQLKSRVVGMVDNLTQNEYDSLLRRSGLQGQDNNDAGSLLAFEDLVGKRRETLGHRTQADPQKVKTLLGAIRTREIQISNASKFAIGSQTGLRRAL